MLSDSPFARAIVVGVIGGTISELSGDKFLNGAGSAVFAELFNHTFSGGYYTEAFDDRAADVLSRVTALGDAAVDYWIAQGGVAGAVGGTLAGVVSEGNIGNMLREFGVGAAIGGVGKGENWAFQAKGGAQIFFSGSKDARGLAIGAERLGMGATIYSTRTGKWIGANNFGVRFWRPVSFMFAATTIRATFFLGSGVEPRSIWNSVDRPILQFMRNPMRTRAVP